MPELIIMCGNIGSGKSTLAAKYANRGYVIVNLDSLRTSMQGGHYYIDNQKTGLYNAIECCIIKNAIDRNMSIVIDKTNMTRNSRLKYIHMIKESSNLYNIICYDFGPGNHSSLSRRIRNSNQTPPEVWEKVHQMMTRSYQAPASDEGFEMKYIDI